MSSQYSRLIEVDVNTVYFDDEHGVSVDCSYFKERGIKFVCEEDGVMWVENKPFTGRVYEFDREYVEQVFKSAEEAWTKTNDAFMNSVDVVLEVVPYNLIVEIDKSQKLEEFYNWANSEERTLLEKAYFNTKFSWRRDETILLNCLNAIGFSEEQIDDLFEAAYLL
jgi:hypothetical protein